MCHSKNNSVSFMFKLCISKATSLIFRNLTVQPVNMVNA